MRVLQKIRRMKDQMERLCQAASKDGGKGEKGDLSFRDIDKALKSRMEEYERFEVHRGHLAHLCNQIHADIKG